MALTDPGPPAREPAFELDRLPQAVFSLDAAGRIRFLSQCFRELTGHPVSGWVGRRCDELVHPGDRTILQACMERAETRGSCRVRLLTASDTARWFELWLRRSPGDGCLFGTMADIDERMRDEAVLLARHRSLSALIGDLPAMVYRCRNDRDWTMEYISNGGEAITGYPVVDLVNNAVRSYDSLIHEEDHERVWAEVQSAVRVDRVFDIIYRIRARGGSIKWVWERGRGIFSDDGELLGLEGFVTEVTDDVIQRERADRVALYPGEGPMVSQRLFRDRVERAQLRGSPFGLAVIEFSRLAESLPQATAYQAAIGQLIERLAGACAPLDSLCLMQSSRFALLLELDAGKATAGGQGALAERAAGLLDQFRPPLVLPGGEHHLSCSVGATSGEHGYAGFDGMYQDAVVALDQARGSGERHWVVFRP